MMTKAFARKEAAIQAAPKHDSVIDALDREKALGFARAMVPVLKERAEQCVRDRCAPHETIEDLKRTGLMRLLQPKKYGGYELSWDLFCEIIQILATGCGSQGWVYRVLGDHAQMIGIFPDEGQREVWGEDINAIASSSFAPVGRAIPTDRGYVFSGKHRFSSGIDHAQWVICGGIVETTGGKRTPNYFLVRKSEGQVIDDWFVNGLEGTGSKSFEVENVFVPIHRVLNWDAAALGRGPGAQVHSAAIFRLPRGGYTTSGFSALAVGMAQGMLTGWLDLIAKRKSEGGLAAAQENIQITAAEASAKIAAAETLYLTTIRDAMRELEATGRLPEERTAFTRARMAYSCQLVLKAAHTLHQAMGSSAVYSGSPIERQYRNILVGLQHIGVNWPRAAAGYGVNLLREHGADIPSLQAKD